MHKSFSFLAAVALATAVASASAQQERTLDIYFIDTEGGQATLFVSPSGESMLVDAGFAGNAGMPPPPPGTPDAPPMTRDTDRIMAAIKEANVRVLDFLVITHYHGDHVGGAAELATRIPIRHFVDHGPYTVEQHANRAAGFLSYLPVRQRGRAIVPEPGDRIPIAGLDVEIVSSAGRLITEPIQNAPGAGEPNPYCREAILKDPDPTPENLESLGMVVRHGSFRLLNLGDLTWNQEHALVCPLNLLGTVDVFHTTRHGDPNSGAPQMVHAIGARVAVMNNGERKGGSPEYWKVVRSAPGLEDFWQLHRSAAGGTEYNSPEPFLANINETDHGYYIKMSVRGDGSFTMTNQRNGFTKEYPAPGATN